jgi:hypothetical protein
LKKFIKHYESRESYKNSPTTKIVDLEYLIKKMNDD